RHPCCSTESIRGRGFMGLLLKIVGSVWALLGAGNIIGMPWDKGSSLILTFGLIFNMLLFVIPGLVVYGIGAGVSKGRNIQSGLNKKCPFCAEVIKQEARFCRYCGRELSPAQTEVSNFRIILDSVITQTKGMNF